MSDQRPAALALSVLILAAPALVAPAGAAAGRGSREPAPKTAGGSSLSPRIPDATVYDQNGRRLRFYSDLVKGKTVAINFIFTTCTATCPTLTATFRRVQQALGDRVGRDTGLISVSVDPTTDVPERLRAYAAKFDAGPGWTFVTGARPEIDSLLRALGAYAGSRNDHSPMILIGNDAAGYWTRTYGLSPASRIASLVREVAARGEAAAGSGAASGRPARGGPAAEAAGPAAAVPLPVVRSEAGAPAGRPQRGGAGKVRSPSEVAASYFPNPVLLTQEGRPVRFYDDLLKGRVVLINFMFTTCTGVCPAATANLAKVQAYLGDRVGRDIVMISITLDPITDTPEALGKFAAGHGVKPGWYFLTGKKEQVDRVLYKLGGYVEDKNRHNGLLIIGNEATGEWMKVPSMARAGEIAAAAMKLVASRGGAAAGPDAGSHHRN